MQKPKVSVFIPVYNHAAYVGAAVESVLAQDFRDFELILVDDKSPDDSFAVLQGFDDPRIRLYRNEANLGISANRNRMFDLVRGDYVALLDSDDRMAPRRLARQVAFLDANPAFATVGGCAAKCDNSGRIIKRVRRPLCAEQLRVWMLFRTTHANTTFMGRMAMLRDYRYDESYFTSGDYELSLRLADAFPSANLPEVLSYLRQHDARTTSTACDRVKQEKFRLIALQLERLGICPAPSDLERHYQLTRLTKQDLRADAGYLEWTRGWLERIAAANRAASVYEPRALAEILGFVWAQTCLKAGRSASPRDTWQTFSRSPLRSGLAGMVATNLRLGLRSSTPRAPHAARPVASIAPLPAG